MGSIVFSSEEEDPLSPGQDDRQKVRKWNIRPLGRSEVMNRPANEPARVEKSVDRKTDSLMDKPPVDESPEWSDSELMPLITLKGGSVVDMMDLTGCPLPKCSEVLTPQSPATISFEDQDGLSAPLTITPQLISEQYMVELHSLPGRDTIFGYLADYVNTLSPI